MNDLNNPTPPPYDALAAFRWWEGKRWIFNLAVGLTGFVSSMPWILNWDAMDIASVFFYGIAANVGYTFGGWFEMMDQAFLKGGIGLNRARVPLLIVGTCGSMLMTALLCLAYYGVLYKFF